MDRAVGRLVEHPAIPGIGRVGELDDDRVRIDAFESVSAPVVGSQWVRASECRAVRLMPQTRVYWQDPDTGRWQTGRVLGGGPDVYFVRVPNRDVDFQVPETYLRVRWDRPIESPVEVLAASANESPYFRDARLPMLKSLVSQRAACANLSAVLSAAIEVYPHQMHAALTVLSDPVQRYLLADEVGLGKTIEAGLVIRQNLLDRPRGRIAVLAPDVLREQWQTELCDKFFIEDFPLATVKISRHETPDRWSEYHGFDLVVVDEAHRLTQVDDPAQAPYRQLAELAHSTPRLLLLSATPATSSGQTYLAMLHLLDPVLYSWADTAEFTRRFQARRVLANAVYSLDADFEPLLPGAIEEITALISDDVLFRRLAADVIELLSEAGDLRVEADRPTLRARVDALRAHISETYRLHRRIIRHRRHNVLAARANDHDTTALPFEVTGRQRPKLVNLGTGRAEPAVDALLQWQQRVAGWLLDHAAADHGRAYGQTLSVLCSRVDEVSADLLDALRWRVHRDHEAADRAGLSALERELLAAPAVLPVDDEVLAYLADDRPPPGIDLRGLAAVVSPYQRAVVFCGPGSLAGRLVDALAARMRRQVVEHSYRAGPTASATAVKRWRRDGGVLVADDSAEDGINLQDADAVIHMRLPWSPNRFEQRLGRVDRFAGAFGAARPAADQHLVIVGEEEQAFSTAWATLMTDAFRIFDGSISALQDALDQLQASVWAVGVQDGPAAMRATADLVVAELDRERRDIDGMDTLEAIHEGAVGRTVAEAVETTELRWADHEAALRGYAGEDAGGLRFAARAIEGARHTVRFERGNAPLLVSPRLLALSGRAIPDAAMQGTFNRNTALRTDGLRLFRLGNPFVDMLARVVAVDDRGQASAFWRRGFRGDAAAVFFGLDVLVEADTGPATALTASSPDAQSALRRQADLIFPPFMRRIWLRVGDSKAVEDIDLQRWLDSCYDPRRGDINLNDARIAMLWDHFGGMAGLAAAARDAERHGRLELARSADLTGLAQRAQNEADRALGIHRAQAQARQRAGRLLSDTESYLLDVEVSAALVAGLAQPSVWVMAVTCVVGGELWAKAHGD